MPNRHRAFTAAFVNYLQMHQGWPKQEAIEDWVRGHGGHMTSGVAVALRNGEFTREPHVVAFLTMVLTEEKDSQCIRARQLLTEYLQQRGFNSVSTGDVEAIMGHVCQPPLDGPPDGKRDFVDYLYKGIRSVGEHIFGHLLRSNVLGCTSEAEVFEAIAWMYGRVGQLTHARGTLLSTQEAIAAGQDVIRLPVDEYKRRAAAWHAFNSWTVVRAKHRTGPVGVTIVLPVTQAAYDDVLEGRRPTYDCVAQDFQVPSTQFILEACAERPECVQSAAINPTRPLFLCLAHQLAALMRFQSLSPGTQVRYLAFAGTPKARERLLNTGFKPTGRNMAVTGVELFEHTLRAGTRRGIPAMENMFLRYFGDYSPGAPPLPR